MSGRLGEAPHADHTGEAPGIPPDRTGRGTPSSSWAKPFPVALATLVPLAPSRVRGGQPHPPLQPPRAPAPLDSKGKSKPTAPMDTAWLPRFSVRSRSEQHFRVQTAEVPTGPQPAGPRGREEWTLLSPVPTRSRGRTGHTRRMHKGNTRFCLIPSLHYCFLKAVPTCREHKIQSTETHSEK